MISEPHVAIEDRFFGRAVIHAEPYVSGLKTICGAYSGGMKSLWDTKAIASDMTCPACEYILNRCSIEVERIRVAALPQPAKKRAARPQRRKGGR